MTARAAIGVYREERFSPGRVDDDRAVLDSVADRLREQGVAVRAFDGDRLPSPDVAERLVFAMCQGERALAWLEALGRETVVVNPPRAIRNCYRTRMLERFAAAGVPHPTSALAESSPPADLASGPWLKRGDVHAMEAGDVRRVFGEAEWRQALGELRERGVASAVVQDHAEGTVFKFYGVAGRFFRAYGLPSGLERAAEEIAAAGAAALELEVWGGDGVAGPDGSIRLIDFNDWPSFSRCRDEAAAAIAGHLLDRLENGTERRRGEAIRDA
ncbi:MAG: hypothetical protein QOD06_1970 [Candidatus Binatota bacterium]|nr:hypothetical protein [Candidatus Binatota bacterium]